MQGPRDAGDITLNTHDARLEQIPLLRSGEVPAALLPIHADHPCGSDLASRGSRGRLCLRLMGVQTSREGHISTQTGKDREKCRMWIGVETIGSPVAAVGIEDRGARHYWVGALSFLQPRCPITRQPRTVQRGCCFPERPQVMLRGRFEVAAVLSRSQAVLRRDSLRLRRDSAALIASALPCKPCRSASDMSGSITR